MSNIKSNLLVICLILCYLEQVFNASAYNEEKYNSRYYYDKSDGSNSKLRNIPESISKGKGILGKFSKYKSDVQVETPRKGIFKAAEFESPSTEPPAKNEVTQKTPKPPKPPTKIAPVKQNETEAEKAERIHRTFEKLLTFVEIVGQVDNYVSTKWKNLVRTVSNLYEEEEEENYRLGFKKFKGCPAFIKEN